MPKQSEQFSFADESAPEKVKVKVDPAQLLLDFLQRWKKPTVSEREIRIYGPGCIRTRESVINTTEVLTRRGWLTPHKAHRRNKLEWQIIRQPLVHPVVET